MSAAHRRRHDHDPALSTPSSPAVDAPSMPKRSSQLSLRARRRSATGAELVVDVDARGGPAIAAVALLLLAAAVVVLLRWLS